MTNVCPKKFASTLPKPRFKRYLDYAEECSSNPNDDQTEIAVKLYAWNTALSAAFYESLQSLEIALRNAIHKQMTDALGEDWYDHHAKFFKLDKGNVAKLVRAKRKMEKKGPIHSADDIIADLSLGFWIKLFEYKRLWHKELHKVFFCEDLTKDLTKKELQKERENLHKRLDGIKDLRNRIAHHEPIFHQNLEGNMANIIEILGWICPITRDWVKEHNRFDEVMKNCPIKRQ